MRLYHKLNAALVVTALLSAGLLSVIFFRFQRAGIIENEKRMMSLTAQGVRNVQEEAVLARDQLMLVDYLSGLYAYHPEIAALETFNGRSWQLVRPRGKTAGAVKERPGKPSPPRPKLAAAPPPQDSPPEEFAAGGYGARIYFSRKYLSQERARQLAELSKRLYWSLAAAVCVSALLALALNFHLTRRLRALSLETKVLGEGRFGHTVDIRGSDEIAQLAANFNSMSRKLLELETMKKDFTASVTHELRSPLGAIESHVSLLLRKERPQAERESLERIKANAGRLANFVTSLLDLARIERGKMDLRPGPRRGGFFPAEGAGKRPFAGNGGRARPPHKPGQGAADARFHQPGLERHQVHAGRRARDGGRGLLRRRKDLPGQRQRFRTGDTPGRAEQAVLGVRAGRGRQGRRRDRAGAGAVQGHHRHAQGPHRLRSRTRLRRGFLVRDPGGPPA